MPLYVVAIAVAAVVALIATPIVSKFANKTGALDKPNQRKVHKKPIPRIGGVAFSFQALVPCSSRVAPLRL